MKRIYLDHAATTPVDFAVLATMRPWMEKEFGNPSSLYFEGRRARQAIDEAREKLSARLGCLFAEVLFTSSGTEAANLAIVGAALANEDRSRNRILVGAAEHHCVLHTKSILERLGYQVQTIQVDRVARVNLDQLEAMLGADVLLVSVMHANNELGTILPVSQVSEAVHRHGALFHCDMVQTLGTGLVGKTTLNDMAVDLASFSSHKIYGPKGAGAIFVRAGTQVKPLAVGGGQERELRAGTENVAAIVGFGAAAELPPASPRAARDAFLDELSGSGLVFTTSEEHGVLDGHAHLRAPGKDAETVLIQLDRAGVSASSGAACSSGSLEPSHVLLACGYSEQEAKEGLRFTFGRATTVEDAVAAARILHSIIG